MTTIEAFRRELDIFIDEALSDSARSALFVAMTSGVLEDFEAAWRARVPDASFQRWVDGAQTKSLEEVSPGGVVVERVVAIAAIVRRALELFDLLTKVVTGDYKSMTHVFSKGARAGDIASLSNTDDFVVIANVSAFARKAEQQAFNIVGTDHGGGLFENIAVFLQEEFAAAAHAIYFTYRTIEGNRVPVLAIGGSAKFAGQRVFGVDRGGRARKRNTAVAYARRKGR